MTVVPFRPRLYEAKVFQAGAYGASGTLCGHIDFIGPFRGTCILSPDEAWTLAHMLLATRQDVLNNSNPATDPRII